MPIGDAVQERPTLEQEMAKFKGYSTTDGEVSTGEQTPAETATLAANEPAPAEEPKEDKKPAKVRSPLSSVLDPDGDDAEGDEVEAEEPPEGAADDTGDAEGDEEEAPQPKKPKPSLQTRIDEAIKRQRTAERRAVAAETRLAALERGERPALTPKSGTATAQDAVEAAPDPATFDYGEMDPGYISALARHEAKKALRDERSAQDKTRQDEAAEQSALEHVQAVAAFSEGGAEKYDDFEEVVVESAKAGEWPLTAAVGELMLESPWGHDIAYHLATHPVEARKLAAKSPAAQAATFGRMEAKLEAEAASQSARPTVKPSKAPPPPKTPRGPRGKYTVAADTTSFADFEKLAMARR